MRDRKKIIKIIKDLLRLSEDGNSQHQAKSALEKARNLIKKYRLTDKELALSDIVEYRGKYKIRSEKVPMHFALLASTCKELFNCDLYWATKWNKGYITIPVFVGYEPNISICKYTYDVLHRKLVKARSEFGETSNLCSKAYKTREKDSFAYGWVLGVRENIKHLIPKRRTIKVDSPNGLISVDPLELYVKSVATDGEMKAKNNDITSAARHGFADGSLVNIDKGVDGNSKFQKYL